MTIEQDHVLRAIQGDQESLAWLYEYYKARVYWFHYCRVCKPQTAEDLTSETFLKVMRSIHSYKPGPTPFYAWIKKIARNVLVDYLRRRRMVLLLADFTPGCRQSILNRLTYDMGLDSNCIGRRTLASAIETLPPFDQWVLHLKYELDFNWKEVAETAGMPSEWAAKAKGHRIRAQLRIVLGNDKHDM